MRTTMKWIFSVIAAGIFLSSSTAWADEIFVELNVAGVDTRDNGFVGLTGATASGGGGLLVGYEMDQVPGLRLLGSYGADGMSGSRFSNQLRYDWVRNRLSLGADYGVDLLNDMVRPLIRVTTGYSHQSLNFRADETNYRGSDHGLHAMAAAGMEFSFGRGEAVAGDFFSRMSFGVNFLVGYLWQTGADFDNMSSTTAPSEPNDEDPWQRVTYDAGSLQMSGVTWTLGASLRYNFGS